MRRLVSQWQQCADKSKINSVKDFYQKRLESVHTYDKPCWKHLVHKIEVDITRQQQPRIYVSEEDENKIKAQAQKRKVGDQLGPDRNTPSSVERKPKGARHLSPPKPAAADHTDSSEDDDQIEGESDNESDDMEEVQSTLATLRPQEADEIQPVPAPIKGKDPKEKKPRQPLATRDMNVETQKETGSQRTANGDTQTKPRRVNGTDSIGNEENQQV